MVKIPSVTKSLFVISIFLLISLFFIVLVSKKDVRGVESNVVYTIERVVSNNNALYENMESVPYSLTQYSPIYYLTSDFLLSVFNVSVQNNSYWVRIILRLQSLIFLCLVIVMGIRSIEFIRGDQLKKEHRLLFGILVIVCTAPWYFISRPDVLVLLFYISSFYYLALGFDRKKSAYLVLAGFIGFMAFLSKQNGLLIVLFTGLFLLLKFRFRFLLFYVLGTIVSAGVFVGIYLLSGYPVEWILLNLTKGVDNGIDIYKAINGTLLPFLALYGFPTLLVIALVVDQWDALKKNLSLVYLSYFAVFTLGFALLTSIKVGSAENYFNEFIVLVIILAFLVQKNITKKILILCLLFSISVGSYHLVKYSPRSIYFTFFNKHYQELSYSESFLKDLGDQKYFYSNIRNLIIDYPERCVFPQYEIANAGIGNESANNIYREIVNNINYDVIDLLIIDNNIEYLPFDLTLYKLVDEHKNISIYKHKNLLNE